MSGKKKVYIAGPMTGFENFNKTAFFDMARVIVGRGHVALNPAILPDGLEQREYMDICIAMVRCANTICLLDGWEASAGARAERAVAEKIGVELTHESDWSEVRG